MDTRRRMLLGIILQQSILERVGVIRRWLNPQPDVEDLLDAIEGILQIEALQTGIETYDRVLDRIDHIASLGRETTTDPEVEEAFNKIISLSMLNEGGDN